MNRPRQPGNPAQPAPANPPASTTDGIGLGAPAPSTAPDSRGLELYQAARDRYIDGNWGVALLFVLTTLALWGVVEWSILRFAGRRYGYDGRVIFGSLGATVLVVGVVIGALRRRLYRWFGLHDDCPRCRGWLDVHPFLPVCGKCGFQHYEDWRRHHRAEALDPGPVPVRTVRRLIVAEAVLILVLSAFAFRSTQGSPAEFGVFGWVLGSSAASVGLWWFWNPARTLHLVTRAGALVAMPFLASGIGATSRDSTGLLLVLVSVALMLAAVITFLLRFTALARTFEPDPATAPTPR